MPAGLACASKRLVGASRRPHPRPAARAGAQGRLRFGQRGRAARRRRARGRSSAAAPTRPPARCAGRVRVRPAAGPPCATAAFSAAISRAKVARASRMASRSASITAIASAASPASSSRPPVERRGRALLEVGDARERRLQPPAFGLVLRDRDRERPLGALGGGRRVADLLVEDQQRAAVGEVFLGAEAAPRIRVTIVLSIGRLHCYLEQCSRSGL